MPYATDTKVSAEKSRMEIEVILNKHGATEFTYATRVDKAMIQFRARDRVVRFILPLPTVDTFTYRMCRGYRKALTNNQRQSMWEQSCRTRWRALKLAILAKLESVESGIEQFEEAFMAHVVDPVTNRTIYEVLSDQIALSYSGDHGPLLLPSPESADACHE
jgi:hypothetical protein